MPTCPSSVSEIGALYSAPSVAVNLAESGRREPRALNVPTKPGKDELIAALQPLVVWVGKHWAPG